MSYFLFLIQSLYGTISSASPVDMKLLADIISKDLQLKSLTPRDPGVPAEKKGNLRRLLPHMSLQNKPPYEAITDLSREHKK